MNPVTSDILYTFYATVHLQNEFLPCNIMTNGMKEDFLSVFLFLLLLETASEAPIIYYHQSSCDSHLCVWLVLGIACAAPHMRWTRWPAVCGTWCWYCATQLSIIIPPRLHVMREDTCLYACVCSRFKYGVESTAPVVRMGGPVFTQGVISDYGYLTPLDRAAGPAHWSDWWQAVRERCHAAAADSS